MHFSSLGSSSFLSTLSLGEVALGQNLLRAISSLFKRTERSLMTFEFTATKSLKTFLKLNRISSPSLTFFSIKYKLRTTEVFSQAT